MGRDEDELLLLVVTMLPENPEVVEWEEWLPFPFVLDDVDIGGVLRLGGVLSSDVTSMLSSVIIKICLKI